MKPKLQSIIIDNGVSAYSEICLEIEVPRYSREQYGDMLTTWSIWRGETSDAGFSSIPDKFVKEMYDIEAPIGTSTVHLAIPLHTAPFTRPRKIMKYDKDALRTLAQDEKNFSICMCIPNRPDNLLYEPEDVSGLTKEFLQMYIARTRLDPFFGTVEEKITLRWLELTYGRTD